jgi:hypothetical protein
MVDIGLTGILPGAALGDLSRHWVTRNTPRKKAIRQELDNAEPASAGASCGAGRVKKQRKEPIAKRCAVCEQPFLTARTNRLCCSPECKRERDRLRLQLARGQRR